MMIRRSYHASVARRAVTLLEVVLAMGILGAVSGMTYWFYASSLETNREGTQEAQTLRLARSVLDRIALEIRQAAMMTADKQPGVRGQAERISLSSLRVPSREQSKTRDEREEPPPGEYDLIKVDYRIVRHPEIEHPDGYEFPLGLARVEIPVPRPLPVVPKSAKDEENDNGEEADTQDGESPGNGNRNAPTRLDDFGSAFDEAPAGSDKAGTGDADLGPKIQWDELYAPEIRYLRFCYYDGAKWWDSWDVGGESPLPQLVMVTIGYEPVPPFDFKEMAESKINEEFCTCLNKDPVDCEPLKADQYSTVVRIPQSDPLFRSRITRESQAMIEELFSGKEQEVPGGGQP